MNKNRNGLPIALVLIALAIGGAGSAPALEAAQPRGAALAATPSKIFYLPLLLNGAPPYNWLQFNGDAQHSGANSLETLISPGNVSALGVRFQVSLAAVADSAPVALSAVTTTTGLRNLIFVTTRAGDVAALDASTGQTIWAQPSRAASCLINNNVGRNEPCYTTAAPAIDPNRQYLYSYELDGYVHKFKVGDGTEVVTGGWPELTSLKVYDEKGSSDLSVATAKSGVSYLYVAHGGYPGDAGNYQGNITAINLSDGTQKVFNALCSDKTVHFVDTRVIGGADCYPNAQSAIWARAGVVYDSNNDELYMGTGNGAFSPGSFLWGDTIFSLHADGTGAGNGNPLDSYTPTNFQDLDNSDADLGSTAPALLPTAGGLYPHLAVQGGKDALLRLLNLDNLSGRAAVGHTGGEVFSMTVPMGGEILTQPAVWVNPADSRTWVFVSNGSGLAGLQLVVDGADKPSLQSRWTAGPGTSPIVVNGVLFYARSGLISGLNPTTGALLWSNNQIGGVHWESPIVVNGMLYQTDESGNLTGYSLH